MLWPPMRGRILAPSLDCWVGLPAGRGRFVDGPGPSHTARLVRQQSPHDLADRDRAAGSGEDDVGSGTRGSLRAKRPPASEQRGGREVVEAVRFTIEIVGGVPGALAVIGWGPKLVRIVGEQGSSFSGSPPRSLALSTCRTARTPSSASRRADEASKRQQNPSDSCRNPRKHVTPKPPSTCGTTKTCRSGEWVGHPCRGSNPLAPTRTRRSADLAGSLVSIADRANCPNPQKTRKRGPTYGRIRCVQLASPSAPDYSWFASVVPVWLRFGGGCSIASRSSIPRAASRH